MKEFICIEDVQDASCRINNTIVSFNLNSVCGLFLKALFGLYGGNHEGFGLCVIQKILRSSFCLVHMDGGT